MFYIYEEQIIDSVKKIVKKYSRDLYLVVIYGSFARQQHMPDSDLDLLIVGKDKVKKQILDDLSEIYVRYSIVVSALFYSPSQYHIVEHHPFIKQALKEGITLWEKKTS